VGDLIFGGTGTLGHLFLYNPGTGLSEDLGEALPGQSKVASLAAGPDGLVYGGSGATSENGHLFRFDPDSPAVREDLDIPVVGSLEAGNLVLLDGKIYGATADQYTVFSYDPMLDKLTVEGQVMGAMEITCMTAGPDGRLYGGDYPGGQFWWFDPGTGQGTVVGTPVPGEVFVRSVVAGTDGDVYGGTGSVAGHFFRYDTGLNTFELLGVPVWRDSSVLSLILGSDGRIYGGTGHRRGKVFRFDPANGGYAPEGTATSSTISPRMKDKTYVPATSEVWALAMGSDGMLYASGYAATGDAKLYRWDPGAGGLMELVGVIPGSEPYVVYDLVPGADGLLYGGSGGWDGPIFFSYDPGSDTLAEIPLGMALENWVTALALCPNGLIYGAASGTNGQLFSYNPATGTVQNYGQAVAGESEIDGLICTPNGTVYGGTYPTAHLFRFSMAGLADLGVPFAGETSLSALQLGADGQLYGGTSGSGRFFRYDPVSGEVSDLGRPFAYDTEIWNLTASPDGLIWGVTSGTEGHLFSYEPGAERPADLGRVYAHDRFVFGLTTDATGQTIYMGTGWNYGEMVAYERGYRFGWLSLGYSSVVTEGTELAVDVLDPAGNVLLADVSPGGSLLPMSGTDAPAIQLRATLATSAPNGTPELLDWAVEWTEDPVMAVDPADLHFFATAGGPDPSPQTLSITNSSGGELTWSITGLPEWLQVEPMSGTAPSEVTVTAGPSGLPGGVYTGTLVIDGGDTCANCPVEVPVSLTLGWRVCLPLVEHGQ